MKDVLKVIVALVLFVGLIPLWLPMLAVKVAWGIARGLDEEIVEAFE